MANVIFAPQNRGTSEAQAKGDFFSALIGTLGKFKKAGDKKEKQIELEEERDERAAKQAEVGKRRMAFEQGGLALKAREQGLDVSGAQIGEAMETGGLADLFATAPRIKGFKTKEEKEIAKEQTRITEVNKKDVTDLRKEISNLRPTKDIQLVDAAFRKVKSALGRNSAAGDLGGIFNVMKMFDPGSTVREGEFATAQNSAGVPDRLRNMYNQAKEGVRLNPKQREDFLVTAQGQMTAQIESWKNSITPQLAEIEARGFDRKRILPTFGKETQELLSSTPNVPQAPVSQFAGQQVEALPPELSVVQQQGNLENPYNLFNQAIPQAQAAQIQTPLAPGALPSLPPLQPGMSAKDPIRTQLRQQKIFELQNK